MSMYSQGNLAIRQEKQPETQYVLKTEVVRRKTTIPAHEKLLYLFVVVLCVVIAGAVIWKHAQVYSVNTAIQQVERQIAQLEKENQSLRLEVNRLREPNRLIEIGKSMGLEPVEADQIREIGTSLHRGSHRVAVRE